MSNKIPCGGFIVGDGLALNGKTLTANHEPSQFIKNASVSNDTLTLTKNNDTTVVYTPTGTGAQWIELTGWSESQGWHEGGTLTNEQAQILLANELNYIWMNGMHRLDFRYRDDNNNMATYSANDGQKTHVIQIRLSDKSWEYAHNKLQFELTAGNGISISSNNTISANVLPAFTAEDNGKVLKIVDGALAWVTP